MVDCVVFVNLGDNNLWWITTCINHEYPLRIYTVIGTPGCQYYDDTPLRLLSKFIPVL